jgi:calcium-translocating P-type ATPase, PMCA-type
VFFNLKFNGLTKEEVARSYQEHGNNALSSKETETFLSILIGAFDDPWIKVLLFGLALKTVINIACMINPSLGHADWIEVVSLIAAIGLSTGVASFSEWKNGKEFNSLQEQASKIVVKVYRDGHLHELNIDELVIGDVVQLRAGDQIPADGIILDGTLKVNQASLNGESEDANKYALGDNPMPSADDTFNEFILLRGSYVTEGEAVMEVTTIGDNTMLGSINVAIQEDGKESPSTEKLSRLAGQIGVMGSTGAIGYLVINAILVSGLINTVARPDNWFFFIIQLIMYAVTIVIMAVPEGLPMMLAMVASMNSRRLLAENILVRKPASTETAGYINILFSDKTGTITEGVLKLVDVLQADGTTYTTGDTEGLPFEIAPASLKEELKIGLGLNNDSVISDGVAIDSNQTDRALMTFLYSYGLVPESRESVVSKEAFTSATKFASVTLGSGETYIKGAPEIILSGVTKYIKKDGSVGDFTPEIAEKFNSASIEQANRSMRVLAIVKQVAGVKTLIAGVCIRDNVRQGIKETVRVMNEAGVTVVMVTGDRKETAVAIAKEAGIYKSTDDVVLTHDELASLSDEEVKTLLPRLKVVSRALPLDKKRLVNLAQEIDLVAGMTGDGVNDAPSLKAADIGFSMGDGTQAAQENSDVVILNNSLTSIEKAVLYGRTMTESVKKFIIFQLTVNVTTIALALIGPLVGFKEPFTIIQILWINLIMDTLAALAFGEEPTLERYMKRPPIGRKENILTGYMKSAIGVAGLFITVVSTMLLANLFNLQQMLDLHDSKEVLTFMFTFFIYAVIFNSLNTRSHGFNVFEHIGRNKRFIYVMVSIAIVQSLIIQFGGEVFNTVPMDLKHFGMALGLAFLIIPVDMIRKALIGSFKN